MDRPDSDLGMPLCINQLNLLSPCSCLRWHMSYSKVHASAHALQLPKMVPHSHTIALLLEGAGAAASS